MVSPIARVSLLLASSDLEASELRSLERWLEKNGPRRLMSMIEDLRALSESREPSNPLLRRNEVDAPSPNADLVDRIERLLIDEAGLGKSEAASLLQNELRLEGISPSDVPTLNRTAFSRWIEQVAARVSPSLLLHIATRVRNDRVHGRSSSDWPLRTKQP